MTGKEALIHQALHGYHEGHRLLAASTTVPPNTEQTMAVLSDLSGHGVMRRFDEYLTGYGLPELGAYALSKTWYAPEMPRPGCVWTHTLLIPFGLLGNTRLLHTFIKLFKRPKVGEYREYGAPIVGSALADSEHRPRTPGRVARESGEIIYFLYEAPIRTVIVPTESPNLAEPMFLEVWSQQWPRLRRNFTFCTGAISGRKIDGKWFDLLGVPGSKVDDVHRTIENSVVAKIGAWPSLGDDANWFNAVIDDLGNTTTLRSFLFEFGAEAEKGRGDFASLTKLCLALDKETGHSARSVLRSLRSVFPRKKMGVKLKDKLLAGEIGAGELRTPGGTLELILLARGKLFDTTEMDLRGIAQRAWEHDPENAIKSVEKVIERNAPVDGTILVTLADLLEPDQVASIGEYSGTLKKLAFYRPMILTHDAFRYMEGRNGALLEFLASRQAGQKEVNLVLAQWLREGEFGQIEAASEQQPSVIAPELLNVLIAPKVSIERDFPTDPLIHLCRRFPDQFTKWLKKNIRELGDRSVMFKVMGCIVVGVEYRTIPISKTNVEVWSRLLDNQDELDAVLRESVVMQLFLKAMDLRGAYAARIATATFPDIFRRLNDSQMSYEEWYTLQEAVIGFGWDWNRCRRLTEGLIDKFQECDWPRKHFVEMIAKDLDLAKDIRGIKFYGARYNRFVRRIVREAS